MKNTQLITTVDFPAPQGLQVNMMPFILGDITSLPEDLRAYAPLIEACEVEESEIGKIGYLSVMESEVKPGLSQRRGGVHVERHPATSERGGSWGGGGWGRGGFSKARYGGLYVASNMSETTAIWDACIENPGPGGDCEHVADELGSPTLLKAGELAWLTDSCPHASMPVKEEGTRQFFRLVTSEVDLWFTEHSTPNPLGVTPPARVKLVTENKFRKPGGPFPIKPLLPSPKA
jgi:hypothetical protein